MTATTATGPFASYMHNSIDHIHAVDCPRGKADARRHRANMYPVAGNLRDAIIENFEDVWSDTYATTEEALLADEVANYAEFVKVCPCAVKAGFVNDHNVHVAPAATEAAPVAPVVDPARDAIRAAIDAACSQVAAAQAALATLEAALVAYDAR